MIRIHEPPLAIDASAGHTVYFASLIAGLEGIAAGELTERLPHASVLGALRGKLFFSGGPPTEPLQLKTVEHVFAYVAQLEGLSATEDGLEQIRREFAALDLDDARSVHDALNPAPGRPSFRITAQRAGSHEYNSLEVAAAAGAGVVDRYEWDVDLEGFDYDVRVYVTDDTALVGLRLSPEPLHRRSRVVHAAASLNPTVAHAMCRLAPRSAGKLFVDPMCGAGTVLVERARLSPDALRLGGDLFAEPLHAAAQNLEAAETDADLVQWDARHLPLTDASVDAVVSNLPWGRRIGSHRVNRHLYPGFVRELARVLRPGATAVLLTQEKRLLTRLIGREDRLSFEAQHHLSLSGMHPTIYVIRRAAR